MKIPRFLLEGHKSYLDNRHPGQHELHARLLSEGQSPEALWVGCSDSRVLPETLVCAQPGDLFIVRNVGNMVPAYDAGANSVGAAIEFSLGNLGVSHAIVCGHEDCGMMKAIQKGGVDANEAPLLANWIRDTLDSLGEAAASVTDLTELTKLNILLQVERLKGYPAVAKAIEERGFALHAWFIEMSSGHLEAYDYEKRLWSRLVD